MENARGAFENDHTHKEDAFITVNTIEQTVFVERLPNPLSISRGSADIIKYGGDNLYPNKVKSMAERSQSAQSAVNKLTEFTAGLGWKGDTINEIIVNEEGMTLFDTLDHAANEKSIYRGFALHFNYNIFGEIMEIQEIPFETLRYNKDLSKIVFCPDWSRSGRFGNNKKIEYDLFNPEKVQEQIEDSGGLDYYNGQVLYYIKNRKQIYTLSRFDAALDDVQFEHESGVFKLRNIQNGYSANYIMIYPAPLETELEKKGVINETKQSRGAANSGKTKHIPLNSSMLENLKGKNLIEEIPRTGIDKLFSKQNEETKFNIYAAFNQPPILNGISKDGMFNQESFVDAFDYYNSVTEKDRQEVERVFNKFMEYSIWNVGKLEIEPLQYISRRDVKETEGKETEEKQEENGSENNTD